MEFFISPPSLDQYYVLVKENGDAWASVLHLEEGVINYWNELRVYIKLWYYVSVAQHKVWIFSTMRISVNINVID